MNITSNDIYNLIHQGESTSVEIKKCLDSVPRSVWGTYSAFASNNDSIVKSTVNSTIFTVEKKEKEQVNKDKEQVMEQVKEQVNFQISKRRY